MIAVALNLIRLVHPSRADIIHAQRAAKPNLLLDAQAVLIVVRDLQRSRRKCIQTHRKRTGGCVRSDAGARRGAGDKRDLKGLVRCGCSVNGAAGNTWSNGYPAGLSTGTTSNPVTVAGI